jgi:ATP-dependent DNA helicase DinG
MSMPVDVFGPGGTLARAVPDYEDRPQQRAVADAVARAFAEERALVVEAGTGTGKTLAYLVPALRSGKRVVVSTGTRTLQEQIARHDVPLLEQVLAGPVAVATLKGISNYLCVRRLEELGAAALELDLDDDHARIWRWARQTASGDRAEVTAVADDAAVWSRVTTTPEARLGPRCPHHERCFVARARREAEKAQLVLVNHHLFFADLALRASSPGARVLPDYDAVVFDEAHQVEDVATEHFGVTVSSARFAALARDARVGLRVAGAGAAADRGDDARAIAMLTNLDARATALFARVAGALAGRVRERPAADAAERVMLPPELFADAQVREAWFRADASLEELAAHCALAADRANDETAHGRVPGAAPGSGGIGGAEPRSGEHRTGPQATIEALAALARRAAQLRDDLATVAERDRANHVHWAELRGPTAALRASPVDVAPLMRQHVLGPVPTVVLPSATLTAAGSFRYTRARLGLADDVADELAVASPFDFARQAMLYLPQDLPLPRDDEFCAASCRRIEELLAITGGHAFVLFTTRRALGAAVRALRPRLPYPLWVQGEQPRAALLDRFRAASGSVLLATGSFWEGVDVPGRALSQVIIDKLPFAPPDDPLVAARMQRAAERGADPFLDYQVPQAAIALKQGFGRLIRRGDDRGIVALLDGRVLARRYGRAFLATLPPALPRTSSIEQLRRWWERAPGGPR